LVKQDAGMIRVTVLLFGPARDVAAVDSEIAELADGARVSDLAVWLGRRLPGLATGLTKQPDRERPALRFAVNHAFCGEDHVLQDGDEVAVIPPVSGGCSGTTGDYVALSSEPLDTEHIRERIAGVAADLRALDTGCSRQGRASRGAEVTSGGTVVFEGTTRAEVHPQHGPLVRLRYEAYDDMALAQMQRLAAEVRRRWPIERLALVHRTGDVELAEASVVIAVSCRHRAEAFEACRWLIDTLKRDVPIWKKEVWADGHETWVDPTREASRPASAGEPRNV